QRRARAAGGQEALVGHLPAGLGVARRAIEHELELGMGLWRLAPRHDSETVGRGPVVAHELGVRPGPERGPRPLLAGTRSPEPAGRAGALALLDHLGFEPGDVHAHAARSRDLLRELDREAEGVVERERLRARDRARAEREQALETLHARLVGLTEAGLLLLEEAEDALAV